MSNGKCTLRALLGQSPAECPAGLNPPKECLYWWSLVFDSVSTKAVTRLMFVYVDKAAHMSNTIVRHCQCSCQVHLLLDNKCIVHTNVLWHVLQVLYIGILE